MSYVSNIRTINEATQAASVFTALSKKLGALVRPDDAPPGIAGYVFSVVERDRVDLKSSITDYILEDREAAQDHIAVDPECVSVSGLVSEVHNAPPVGLGAVLSIVRALDPIAAYVPRFAVNVNNIYNEAERLVREGTKVVDQVKSLHALYERVYGSGAQGSLLTGSDAVDTEAVSNYKAYKKKYKHLENRQKEAFDFFRHLWRNKQLVTVETPWGIYKDMAIQTITAQQTASTSTSFEMTFKQIRIIGVSKTDDSKNSASPGRFETTRNKVAFAGTAIGTVAGTVVPVASFIWDNKQAKTPVVKAEQEEPEEPDEETPGPEDPTPEPENPTPEEPDEETP